MKYVLPLDGVINLHCLASFMVCGCVCVFGSRLITYGENEIACVSIGQNDYTDCQLKRSASGMSRLFQERERQNLRWRHFLL
jgi:hypothetical protein